MCNTLHERNKVNKLLVIGSINMDFLINAQLWPQLGETLMADSISYLPGGKGANQAVAAARMGANVSFMGCVGNDLFGTMLIENLRANHVDTEFVKVIEGEHTGVASVTIVDGDNSILIVEGANKYTNIKMIKEYQVDLTGFDIILIQNEIPIDTVQYIMEFGLKNNIKVIYNPAPYKEILFEDLDKLFLITPNEHEIKAMDYPRNSENLIVTLGAKGAEYQGKVFPTSKLDAIDTTGAGDTFNGALCALLLEGKTVPEAIVGAQKACQKAIMQVGAQSAMPYKRDIV